MAPVHLELDRDLMEWDWSGAGGLVPSEEFWSQFEEMPDLGENLENLEGLFSEVAGLGSMPASNLVEHDCMWTGSCHNSDCPKDERKKTVVLEKGSVNLPARPETPQNSDCEEEVFPVIPLYPASQVTNQIRVTTFAAVSFDHNYDKKKEVVVRPEELGVQTPSDTEEDAEENSTGENSAAEEEEEEEEEETSSDDEEIDVVSVASPQRRSLPTNPTVRVRHQLQETVADSLLTASRAVSRRLQQSGKRKRLQHTSTFSSGPGRRRGDKKSRFTCSPDSTEKRSLHNNMERMRRIDLRNAFEELRLLVPSIADSHKAAKVTILKDATHYVKELNFKDRNLSVQRDALRCQQEDLRRSLSQLRRIFSYQNNIAK